MRRALSRFVTRHNAIRLLGTASNFGEMVQMADDLRPDVLVVDLRMGCDVDGEAILFKTQNPNLKILAITAANVADEESVLLAERMGADKLLDKMSLDDQLLPALMELAAIKKYGL